MQLTEFAVSMNAAERALYDSPTFAGYSLWLAPASTGVACEDGATLLPREALEAAVASGVAADATGTATVYPPHATLLGGFSGDSEEVLKAKTAALAASIGAPLQVPAAGVQTQELFFQCVYVLCRATPALAAANAAAQAAFGVIKPGYMPHVSLVYGRTSSLGGADEKAALATRLAADLGLPFLGPREPSASDDDSDGSNKCICFKELQLWDTNGAAQEWRCVASFPLGT